MTAPQARLRTQLHQVQWGTRDWLQTIWANTTGTHRYRPSPSGPLGRCRSLVGMAAYLLGSFLDLRGGWVTTGEASCRLLRPRRWWYPAAVGMVLTPALIVALLAAGESVALPAWAFVVAPPVTITVFAGARTTYTADTFPTRPNRISEAVARHPGAPPGAGIRIVQACHHLAEDKGWIIGGNADNQELLDKIYLPAGRQATPNKPHHSWYTPSKS